MARYKKGVNGPISGKLGKVVGSSWKGIDYLKQAPIRTAPPTENELKNRFVFNLLHEWVSPILEVVKVGFKDFTPTNFGYNAAKSVLNRTALQRDGFDSSIDATKALVSYGNLPLPENLEAELDDLELVFTWDAHTGKEMSPKDQVLMLAYNPETGDNNYTINGQFRYMGRDVLSMKFLPAGSYHIYAAFISEDRQQQSMSAYLGNVELVS